MPTQIIDLAELMVDMVRTLRKLETDKMVDPIYWGGSCGMIG
jgi:hypothetical protein